VVVWGCTGKKVYVIGEVGIEEELDLIGVPHIGGPGDKGKTIDLKPGRRVHEINQSRAARWACVWLCGCLRV
jgi:hypothetical protein